jgi:type II secretory pathway predicted ATPase ExeA
MYEPFYGFSDHPFGSSPDPRFLFLSPTHREALANIKYALTSRKALTVLIGEAGTGKTLVIRSAFPGPGASAPPRSAFAPVCLNNPTLTRHEFLEHVALGFGLRPDLAASKTRFLIALERALHDRRVQGVATALVIDEAQSLSRELLEEVRLLANLQSDTSALLPVVLVGQPELAARLHDPALRQLKQRITLRCSLKPLTFFETASYLYGRLSLVGGRAAQLFSREAVVAIYEASRGIPRTINVVCDNALLGAYALGHPQVDARLVREVCDDFDFITRPMLRSRPELSTDYASGSDVSFTFRRMRPALTAAGMRES